MFGVTILGNNSAIPAFDRHPTAQIVTIKDQLILIDCGEGTQSQIMKYKIKRSKINFILISHLHGDHYFGLMPLITSMGLLGRIMPLYLFGPPALEQIIKAQLQASNTTLPYELHFCPLVEPGEIYRNTKFIISCFKTTHRIACFGFKIEEVKPLLKVNFDKVIEYQIPVSYYPHLKEGKDYTNKQGVVIKNELLTLPGKLARSYAFCADTLYDEGILPHVSKVNLLYHETTYLEDCQEKAESRFHSTTKDAAQIALKASINKLIIGHFSSSYFDLKPFLSETSAYFANTCLAIEGVTFYV